MAAEPPDRGALLDLFRRLTPVEYHAPIQADPSYALFRALAQQFAVLASKGVNSTQARYYLPYSRQIRPPASGPRRARATVTLRRASHLDVALVAEPGEMLFGATGGRRYRNVTRVVFEPNDPSPKTVDVVIECEVPGFVGNLDFLADDAGMIPPDGLVLVDEARDRANIAATLFRDGAGGPAVLRDTGVPDLFDAEDVGLYVRIDASASAANLGALRKITLWRDPQTELPAGSTLYPREVVLDEVPRTLPSEVLTFDAAAVTFTDRTAAAISDVPDDVPVFATPIAQGDELIVTSVYPLAALVLLVGEVGTGDYLITVEAWDGAAWQAVAFVDPSLGAKTQEGEVVISWPLPVTYGAYVSPVSGLSWPSAVRVRQTVVAPSGTTPVLSRVSVLASRPLVPDAPSPTSAGVTWALLDWRDLGLEIAAATVPAGGRDDDLYILGADRGIYRGINEGDESFRQRAARLADVVSPNAIRRIVVRALEALGFEGTAIDVQTNPAKALPGAPSGGFDGLFWDVDAVDYYTTAPADSEVELVETAPILPFGVGFPIDGVVITGGEIVLLADSGTATGAYVTSAGVWSRVPSWGYLDPSSGVTTASGYSTRVTGGLTQAGTVWVVTTQPPADVVGPDVLLAEPLVDPLPFPDSAWKLTLNFAEAYGHFFVLVPFLNAGDFGIGADDGPSIYLPQTPEYTGPAAESGFFDGFPVDAYAQYGALYSSIDAVRAGGVSFTLIRTAEITP